MSTKKVVYVVHAVDVEGPMTETIEATFERMQSYGLPQAVGANKKNLRLIQTGNLPGLETQLAKQLQQIFNARSLGYLNNWSEIDDALAIVLSKQFREDHCSSDGSPYRFSWFIYDHHEGFTNNPRFHEVGTHCIFDHYLGGPLNDDSSSNDGIYWHYHHPANSGDALESGTCWTGNAMHEEIIAKRIIDREWYFSCFRAGLHIERNDISHWLEMFIPFDFSARYSKNQMVYRPGGDFDWRGCSDRWGAWNPDWYDYRKQGSMKRHQFRCTDLWTYLNVLSEEEVEEAFEQADTYGDAVLTYYNHDFRDMKHEIESGYDVLKKVSARYPHIEWKFVNALTAARSHLDLKPKQIKLSYKLDGALLTVISNEDIFGPQPFLAIKENGKYFRDNFTSEGANKWCYIFRNMDSVEAFGVAANTPDGGYDIMGKRLI